MKRTRSSQQRRFLPLEALESRVLLSSAAPIVPPTVTSVSVGLKAPVVVQKKGDVASVTFTSLTLDSGKVYYYWAIQTPGSTGFVRIGTKDSLVTMKKGTATITYKSLTTATVGDYSVEVVIDSGAGAGLVSNVGNFSVIQPSPAPSPSTWVVRPTAVDNSSITMTATTATDSAAAGTVMYDFVCGTKGGHTSGWQTSSTYVDSGLNANTWYSYKVITEDSFSHTGKYSVTAKALTLPVTVSDVAIVLNTASITQNQTAPIASGNATGTGSGPFSYEWDVEMPGGTFRRVGSVHTAKMVNGIAIIPNASMLKSCLGNCTVQFVVDSGASKGFTSSSAGYFVAPAITAKVKAVTGATVSLSASSVSENGTLSASGSITGSGSGPVTYQWVVMLGNGTIVQASDTLTATMINGTATVPAFTGLPTDTSGDLLVWLRVTTPGGKFYGTGSTYTVTPPFAITGATISVGIGSVKQYVADEAFGAITSGIGSGTYNYVWLMQGPKDSAPHQVGGVNTCDVNQSLGTLGYEIPEFDLPTDTLGTFTLWVEIISPGTPVLSDPVSYTVLEPPPEVLFTSVPYFGTPTMTIAGRVAGVDPTQYPQYQGIAVYIYSPDTGGWTGPQSQGSINKINVDGTWSGTIDTSALTSGSNMEIGAFLIPNGATIPTLNGSSLTDALVSDLYAFTQISTKP